MKPKKSDISPFTGFLLDEVIPHHDWASNSDAVLQKERKMIIYVIDQYFKGHCQIFIGDDFLSIQCIGCFDVCIYGDNRYVHEDYNRYARKNCTDGYLKFETIGNLANILEKLGNINKYSD